MLNTKLNPSEVADVNFRLSGTINALRSIWEVMECGGLATEEYLPGLGCIVNSLDSISEELSVLTGETMGRQAKQETISESIESAFPGLSPDVAIVLIKAGLEATRKAAAE